MKGRGNAAMRETGSGLVLRRALQIFGVFLVLQFLWEILQTGYYVWFDILLIAAALICFALAWIVGRVDTLTAGVSQPEQDAPQKEQDSPQE